MDERELHQRAGELFLEALRIPPEGREAWVEQAAGGDQPLAGAVRDLLFHDDAAHALLERPLSDSLGQALRGLAGPDAGPPDPAVGAIDGYELRDVVGEGGTSVVYRAVQSGTTREVALKLLRPGLATPQIVRRLSNEAEVLGQLDHPAIARVFDAGSAVGPTGPLPYIVMELVHGPPVTEWAERHELDTAARVALLVSICEGVEHAHNRGVIHRDIKPANIVVDEHGQPKLLDFGVARLLTCPGGAAETMLTAPGELVGTVAWMSPEQALADGTQLDARSDVYALGLLTFRLLAGVMPYETQGLSTRELLLQAIQVAPRRLGSVDERLRGDLDTIVDRCLRKRPEDRYGSVAQLRVDLQHWLADEPIAARPPTTLELVRRLVRTHRVASAMTAVGLLALVVLLVQQSLARARISDALQLATDARQTAEAALAGRAARAEQERQLSWAIAAFLGDSVTRTAGGSGDETVLELLERASKFNNQAFIDDRGVRGAFLATIYKTYGRALLSSTLGAKAVARMREAVELLEEAYGPEDDRTLAAAVALACRQDEALSERQLHVLTLLVPAVFERDHPVAKEARVVLALHDPDREAAAQQMLALLENTYVADAPDMHLALDIWRGLCSVVPVERRIAAAQETFLLPFVSPPRQVQFARGLLESLIREQNEAVTAQHWLSFVALVQGILDGSCAARSSGSWTVRRSAREYLARASVAQGQLGEARLQLQRLIDDEVRRQHPGWLQIVAFSQRLAQVWWLEEQPAQALATLDHVLAMPDERFERGRGLGSRKGNLLMQRARFLEQLERPAGAEAALLAATDALDWNTRDDAWDALADLLWRQGLTERVNALRNAKHLSRRWTPPELASDGDA
ncbi:MAG: hypothetical protein DRQ55_08880 [Planctomycetota bacterium]|nr:MAG: hypothetical protein DRQ55_08880 [Planctomycetota bacterium]